MRRLWRWGALGLAALAGLAVAAAGAGFLYLRSSLPQTEGEIAVAAVEAPVEITRDADGVVTIRAQSLRDGYAALGFAHAQDRLSQMELMRRTVAGRLSEVIGEATLPIDRFMRTLGFHRLAERQVEHLSPRTREALWAYAGGVNAYLQTHGGAWPPAFTVTGIEPEPWKPAHSLAWIRLMALRLSFNWRTELVRAQLARRLSAEQIDFLWPDYPEDAPVTMSKLARATAGLPLDALADVLPPVLRPTSASNAWAVSGELTESGKPTLANDPHLRLESPGVWYLARIETPERTLVGATGAGFPFLVLGHNGELAWGLTTTHSDTQDLFIEKVDPDDGGRYLTPEGSRPFGMRLEQIPVKDRAAEGFTVRTTRHGPVISDVSDEAAGVAAAGRVLALAWPALRADDRTPDALAALNRADSVDEALSAVEFAHSPQQNVFLADTQGHIAAVAPARVPVRKAGNGLTPVPGWNGEYDWQGLVPFDALPRSVDPPSGVLVNANSRIVGADYSYLIAADWPPPYRAERIHALLRAADRPLSAETMRAMQLDLASPAAGRLLPLMLETAPADARAREAHDLLTSWDGVMRGEQAAPLIMVAWIDHLNRRLLADELGLAFDAFERPDVGLLRRILTEGRSWCDDTGTETAEGCETQVAGALDDALEALTARYGEDMDAWRWGEAHVAAFPHPLFSRLPLVGELLGFGLATGGGDETLNRGGAAYARDPAARYHHRHGASFRAVMDLGNLEAADFVIATGQSGNPLAGSYGSFARRWRDGDYVKLVGQAKDGGRRLRLTPR